MLQLYDKPFTYLNVLFYHYKIFNKHGTHLTINNIPKTQPIIQSFKHQVKLFKYKVKIISPFNDAKTLANFFNKTKVNNYIEYIDGTSYDYIVIINKPDDLRNLIKYSKAIIFQMEPDYANSNWKANYGSWIDQEEKLCFNMKHSIGYNNVEWHISSSVTELTSNLIEKKYSETISAVLGGAYFSNGHKLRVDFWKYFQSIYENTHTYGKDNNRLGFKNHKGELPSFRKDQGLYPYKYTFNAENTDIENYFTEKIIDAILSECLMFYWGCPNISQYLDTKAFINLNLNDFKSSGELIIKSIKENEYEKRYPYIMDMKKRILFRLQMSPRLEGLIKLDNTEIYVLSDAENTDKIDKIDKTDKIESKEDDKEITSESLDKFRTRLHQIGIYRYIIAKSDENKIYNLQSKKNKIILRDNVNLKKNFIDLISMIFNKYNESFIFNINTKEDLFPELIDFDLNKHMLNDRLCYFINNETIEDIQCTTNIYNSIKQGYKWKITNSSFCE